MNDSTEGKWLINILKNTDIELYKFFKKLQKKQTITFKGCFCNDKNNLNLWRLYADDAKGVALGFKIEKQKEGFNNAANPISSSIIANVRYCNIKNKKPKEILTNELYFLKNSINNLEAQVKITKASKNQFIKKEQKNLFRRLNNIIKHCCFKDEKEIAVLITVREKEIKNLKLFNESNNKFFFAVSQEQKYGNIVFEKSFKTGQIIYYSLIFDKIILGPKNKIKKSIIRAILNSEGFKKIEIVKSHLPYK